MVVTSIVLTTVIVFLLVDILLRLVLNRLRSARIQREREQALDIGLRLDVSEESPSLKRVELDGPEARILAVDDEKTVLDSLRKILALGGYSVDTVETGGEVMGLVRRRDYDFVFTDLKMPGMDGVEVTRAVKRLRPDIDVIVITGYATVETAVETVRSGAMDYIQKPFTADELLEGVNKAWIRRQAHREQHMSHKIRLIRPGVTESDGRFELNVPSGAFVSPQHAWARIALNGTVRVGLDDMMRKSFGEIDSVELPANGKKVDKGATLFTVGYGGYTLNIPSPLSGRVTAINPEQAEHPEWLAVRPFEQSWMCAIEPSDLAGELPGLRIGQDAVTWYRKELDRYRALSRRTSPAHTRPEPAESDTGETATAADLVRLLDGFSKAFLQC